jgi:hypothetical protein
MRRIAIALSLSAVLLACAPPAPPVDPFGTPIPQAGGTPALPGADLPPNAPQRLIQEQQSRFSILGDTSVVGERRVVEFSDRYREYVGIDQGFLRYDRLNSGNFDSRETNFTVLRRLISGTEIKETGLRYDDADVKTVQRANLGNVSYVVASSTTVRCFVFAALVGGNQEFSGSRCLPPGHVNMANLEFAMLDLLGRVRLDGGVISRSKPPRS